MAMHYDIAAKVLLEKCREEILRRLLGLSVAESSLVQELPQATLPRMLVARRRDILIESAAYDIIKQEGLQQGLQQGLQEGLQQGKIQEAQDAILDNLEARFEVAPESVAAQIRGIEDLRILKALRRSSVKAASLAEFEELLGQSNF